MPLFGHIETDYALDVWEHPDRASYVNWANRIPGSTLWTIAELPAGTASGAKSDGQGGWINPGADAPAPTPQPDPKPAALTREQFLKLLNDSGGDLSAALKDWPLV